MKKEVILAIAIGFALGLIITFGIWTANKSLKALPGKSTPTPVGVSASPTPTETAISLSLTAPVDEALVATSKVTVSGKTAAGATVAILDENSQTLILADAQGNFSSEVSLVAGYNHIRVIAFDKNGARVEQSVTVTYSTAKI